MNVLPRFQVRDFHDNLYSNQMMEGLAGDKDGNVYKKDSSGSWSKYDNGGWNTVDTSAAKQNASNARNKAQQQRPTSSVSSDTLSGLNTESMSRQRGNQQATNRQRTTRTSRTHSRPH